MPVYLFEIAPFLAGRSVTVRDAVSGSDVASGTLDSNARFTASLPVGDYVASASDGRYTYRASGVVDQGDTDRLADSALSSTFAATLGSSSGTDDTAKIQAALNAGGTVRGLPGQTYLITAPLVIGSNTTLDMTGCTVQWKSGTLGHNLIKNAAMTPQRSLTDASITAGATTLTSPTAAFTAADVGRTVCIDGAGGASGKPTMFTANIVTVTNGTTVELSVSARNTVSGGPARIHARDSKVKVLGGVWDRQNAVGDVGYKLHGLNFRHVDDLTVHIESYRATATGAKYSVCVGSVERASIRCDRLDNQVSDGVHLIGPCNKVDIPYLAGVSGDDFISLTGADYPSYSDTAGDITNVTVGTVQMKNAKAGFKILAGLGWRLDNFKAGHTTGTCQSYAAWVGADQNYNDTQGGTYGEIDLGTIDAVAGGELLKTVDCDADRIVVSPHGSSSTGQLIKVMHGTTSVGGTIKQLIINNPRVVTGQNLLTVANTTCRVDKADINNVQANGSGLIVNANAGVIGHARLNGGSVNYTGSTAPFYSSGGECTTLSVIDCDIVTTNSTGVGGVIQHGTGVGFPNVNIIRGNITGANSTRGLVGYRFSTGAVTLTLDHCNLVDMKRVADVVSTACTVIMTAPRIKSALAPFMTGTGGGYTLIGSLAVLTTATRLIESTATGTHRINGVSLPSDAAQLAPQAGDQMKNTNAALACGTGPVISSGTVWKHLYTGATSA